VIAAGVAAFVAIIGYFVTQAQVRRDRKAREFADALTAVVDFIQLPYIIADRRLAIPKIADVAAKAKADAEARVEINNKVNEVWSHLHFNLTWLQVDSHDVAKKYETLVMRARKEEEKLRKRAWEENLDAVTSEADLSGRYPFYDKPSDWKACIVEMRVALEPKWRFLHRRRVEKQGRGQDIKAPFVPLQES